MPFRNLHFKHILYCCFLNFFHTSLSMLLLHHMYCILSWNHIDLAQENHLPLLGDATSKSSAKLLRHEGLNWLSWNPHIPWSLASFLLEWQQIPWPVNLYVHVWADLKQLILAHASCCVQNFGWYTINTCWYQLLSHSSVHRVLSQIIIQYIWSHTIFAYTFWFHFITSWFTSLIAHRSSVYSFYIHSFYIICLPSVSLFPFM